MVIFEANTDHPTETIIYLSFMYVRDVYPHMHKNTHACM